jgi:hypothetical protein
MLPRLENKLAALVSDATGLAVGVGSLERPAAGQNSLAAAVTMLAAEPGFVPADELVEEGQGAPRKRRILPVRFEATVDIRSSPESPDAAGRGAARAALAGLVSTIGFLFTDADLQTGAGFRTSEADPGFQVLSFGLVSASAPSGLADGSFAGQVIGSGQALLWPPGISSEEGVIDAIERIVAPLPMSVKVADPALQPGKETAIALELGAIQRHGAETNLAVAVLADVPLDKRGTIIGAAAGAEPGVAIVKAGSARPTFPYRAPADDPGRPGRTEYVAIHLATADRRKGVLLGSAAIRLVPAP